MVKHIKLKNIEIFLKISKCSPLSDIYMVKTNYKAQQSISGTSK